MLQNPLAHRSAPTKHYLTVQARSMQAQPLACSEKKRTYGANRMLKKRKNNHKKESKERKKERKTEQKTKEIKKEKKKG